MSNSDMDRKYQEKTEDWVNKSPAPAKITNEYNTSANSSPTTSITNNGTVFQGAAFNAIRSTNEH